MLFSCSKYSLGSNSSTSVWFCLFYNYDCSVVLSSCVRFLVHVFVVVLASAFFVLVLFTDNSIVVLSKVEISTATNTLNTLPRLASLHLPLLSPSVGTARTRGGNATAALSPDATHTLQTQRTSPSQRLSDVSVPTLLHIASAPHRPRSTCFVHATVHSESTTLAIKNGVPHAAGSLHGPEWFQVLGGRALCWKHFSSTLARRPRTSPHLWPGTSSGLPFFRHRCITKFAQELLCTLRASRLM